MSMRALVYSILRKEIVDLSSCRSVFLYKSKWCSIQFIINLNIFSPAHCICVWIQSLSELPNSDLSKLSIKKNIFISIHILFSVKDSNEVEENITKRNLNIWYEAHYLSTTSETWLEVSLLFLKHGRVENYRRLQIFSITYLLKFAGSLPVACYDFIEYIIINKRSKFGMP